MPLADRLEHHFLHFLLGILIVQEEKEEEECVVSAGERGMQTLFGKLKDSFENQNK